MLVITMGIELAAQRATSVCNGVTWALLRNAMLHGGDRTLLLLQLLALLLLLPKWMLCGCVCECIHECFL